MAENPWTNLAAAAGELKTPKSVLNEQAELLASFYEWLNFEPAGVEPLWTVGPHAD